MAELAHARLEREALLAELRRDKGDPAECGLRETAVPDHSLPSSAVQSLKLSERLGRILHSAERMRAAYLTDRPTSVLPLSRDAA